MPRACRLHRAEHKRSVAKLAIDVKTRAASQNFLRAARTARRLVHLANGSPDWLCVDLGAGKGAVTEAIVGLRDRVLAIESDPRLVNDLRTTFGSRPGVDIVCGDVLTVPLPSEPFVIAANPPFSLSTQIIRRWTLARQFQSGALIVEREFATRVSGGYGMSKVSASLGAFFEFETPFALSPAEFHPRPRARVAILTIRRRTDALIDVRESRDYFLFVNYLFERSQLRVGDALKPTTLRLPRSIAAMAVRELSLEQVVELFALTMSTAPENVMQKMRSFDGALPERRRAYVPDVARDSTDD